ncbi:hypothetical protein PIB30_010619 [Stylosanthes scabra]|uniref:Uncharacterized protein n=1 Tax=Stylosanthes scabra TaxID=79078 RepID=A0ABU6U4E1_9FABA|nr:hypothetical protein [Stylosanthes scabra]
MRMKLGSSKALRTSRKISAMIEQQEGDFMTKHPFSAFNFLPLSSASPQNGLMERTILRADLGANSDEDVHFVHHVMKLVWMAVMLSRVSVDLMERGTRLIVVGAVGESF